MSVKCDLIHLRARTKERCRRCQEAGQGRTAVAKEAGGAGGGGGLGEWTMSSGGRGGGAHLGRVSV